MLKKIKSNCSRKICYCCGYSWTFQKAYNGGLHRAQEAMTPDLNLADQASWCSFHAQPVQLTPCEFSLTGADYFKALPLKLRAYLYLLEICLVSEALW